MIRVAGLTYRYPGSTHDAVQGVEFSVRRGEIFGFLGPSGAGKSTIQKILIGVLREYQGTVEVMGRDLPSYGREYYRHVGVSFELPNLYARFTALENLDFFSQLYDKPTKDPLQLLRLVGLEGDAHTRVGEFSKGMKMRLNFCRALLHDPEILFLDEPTSGLDPASARRIMEMIREQKDHGKTVFLTTHNMAATGSGRVPAGRLHRDPRVSPGGYRREPRVPGPLEPTRPSFPPPIQRCSPTPPSTWPTSEDTLTLRRSHGCWLPRWSPRLWPSFLPPMPRTR